jgi:hypothetical protein
MSCSEFFGDQVISKELWLTRSKVLMLPDFSSGAYSREKST